VVVVVKLSFRQKVLVLISNLSKGIKKSLSQLRGELDDHLETINGNTGEIQEVQQSLNEVDAKIEKLNQRFDEMQVFLSKIFPEQAIFKPGYELKPLSLKEKQLFLIMYTTQDDVLLTYRELASTLNTAEGIVRQYVQRLSNKGIPVIRRHIQGKAYIKLDPLFKELQAKRDIVGIPVPKKDEVLIKYFNH